MLILFNINLFWQNIWLDCGRPKSGVVANIIRRRRASSYHYAVLHVRRSERKSEYYDSSTIQLVITAKVEHSGAHPNMQLVSLTPSHWGQPSS